jgi:hypothetical protein
MHRISRAFLGLIAAVNEQGGVAAVIHHQVGTGAVRPGQGLFGAPPIFLQIFALPGENRNPGLGDRRGGVVLGGENIAGSPAHIAPQRLEGFDEHGGLHGHMQAAADARTGQGFVGTVFFARGHQPRHFMLGHLYFATAPTGQRHVLDLVILIFTRDHIVSYRWFHIYTFLANTIK